MGMPGRKTAVEEAVRDKAVNVAWNIVLEYLEDKTADKKEQREIAVKLAVKNLPNAIMNPDGSNLIPKPILPYVPTDHSNNQVTEIKQKD